MSARENETLVRRDNDEVWNQNKVDVIDELYTEDFVLHDMGQDYHGREAYRQYVMTTRSAFPDLHSTIDDIMATEDVVVTRWTFQGTHQGEITLGDETIAPTGKHVTIHGITWNRIANGRIAEAWMYREGVGEQLR
ncbi:MAG TPA: ester cyclase [Caldilineae bacterium]|jgi:steroid delta-isomerase-like uncharacterized protein|nr:ester cyclase [Caldilineae bacterium]